MTKRILAAALLVLTALAPQAALAAGDSDPDTDTRYVQARVVEVGARRIAVITRSEVEHVIAVDDKGTRVTVDGRPVEIKDLREGDVVTVELDEENPMKFARNIQVSARTSEQAARKP